jgi:hypothetical protein
MGSSSWVKDRYDAVTWGPLTSGGSYEPYVSTVDLRIWVIIGNMRLLASASHLATALPFCWMFISSAFLMVISFLT